ncbi:hypothetical protein BM221_006858 [Beauveria bassiana]|uniref:Heterokaryon incompatibility domain-containing protein n=1 Tax=Beauveria bassiana TaxID=176275 RepID=A0A2N6NJ07_BEABA|nr:hypothetical protein BM221_006858 [Beauveria bassiana]
MDFLPLPQDPTFPTPETPYLSSEDWDFGPFCTYLDRKWQALGLTEAPLLPTNHALMTLPLQRIFDAIPAAKLQSFVQTWLYFGLVAEFLGLNELEDGRRLIDLEQARHEMSVLYRECSKDSDDGKLLTSTFILENADIFAERRGLAGELAPRFHYLHQCLFRTMLIVNNSSNQLEYSVRYSIAGLGELFMTSQYAASFLATPRIVLPSAAFNWFRDYLKSGNDVEKQMLSFGWCPSGIEKLRNLFQGVASLHFVTRLRPRTRPSDHTNCTNYACRAFQIDISQYKPRHVVDGCQCDDVHVDEAEVTQILKNSDSYPMLKIEPGATEAEPARITLETYEADMNYVALSHVWADGLGNPHSNALPNCQIVRTANYVANLNQAYNNSDNPRSEYRVWVDTICCPVELEGKAVALERIADVYRNAAHFQDKAVAVSALMQDLYLQGMKDMRFLRIWHDLLNEVNVIRNFEDTSRSLEHVYYKPQLITLQRSIHFRTVSVPSDEPLCIAVLMGLQIDGLTFMKDGEQRMAAVWAALAETLGGLSTSLVFHLEETLSMKGWRWAPKSLLGSLGEDSTLGMDERSLRFGVPLPVSTPSLGMPTPKGLRMRAHGGFMTVTPIRENFDLHPWKGVTKRVIENHVLIHRELTGEWYRIADWHRSRKLGSWSDEEEKAYSEKHPSPLFDCIRSNTAALIFQDFETQAEAMVAILGKVHECLDDDEEQKAMLFERERTVMCWRLATKEVALLNKVIAISNRLADDQVTASLVACGKEASPQRDECLAKVKKWLETTVDREWKEDAEFAQLVEDTMGEDMEGSVWPLILVDYSNLISMNDSAEDQLWFVD